jgi:hypothetical protein
MAMIEVNPPAMREARGLGEEKLMEKPERRSRIKGQKKNRKVKNKPDSSAAIAKRKSE